MSARHQKEKRLRPRNDPYKRDHFNKAQYLRIHPVSSSSLEKEINEDNQPINEYDDIDDYDDTN